MNNDNPLNDIEATKDGKTIMMWVRTIIYIVGLIASVASLFLSVYGDPKLSVIIAQAAAFIASGFGVAFNPINGGK